MKYLLLNGPNLNLLGTREPEVYGTDTLSSIEAEVRAYGETRGVLIECIQSNHEGVLVDAIQQARGVYDGIIYNPAAHTHYSIAIRDAISSIEVPVVEVHLSDINAREEFRKVSVMKDVCIAQIKGKGKGGYLEAIDLLLANEQEA